jgi:hypothetical protein
MDDFDQARSSRVSSKVSLSKYSYGRLPSLLFSPCSTQKQGQEALGSDVWKTAMLRATITCYMHIAYCSAIVCYVRAIRWTVYGAICSGDSQGLGTVVKTLSPLASWVRPATVHQTITRTLSRILMDVSSQALRSKARSGGKQCEIPHRPMWHSRAQAGSR